MAKKYPRNNELPSARDKKPAGGGLAANVPKMPFRWRVNQLDWDGAWGWADIPSEVLLREIVPKLHDYETQKWGEIEGDRNHFVSLVDCIKGARDRLVEIGREEDSLFSLHLTGQKRIWGVRDVALFRVLWWDPEHQVCPSLKKHT